jgi:hypothetical protein
MRYAIAALDQDGLTLTAWRSPTLTIPLEEILSVERLRSRRGFMIHDRRSVEPLRVRCRRSESKIKEHELRFLGVRIVDCWGAIIAPTLLDFEEELAREPERLRQSSDDA